MRVAGELSGEDWALDSREFDAGPDHLIVVYFPADTGAELDPFTIYAKIAADATARAANGQRLLSMSTMPLRHAGAMFGNDGSGYETKTAVAVVYERWPAVKA